MDLRSYKDILNSYGLSINELAEGMQESPLAMKNFLSQQDAPEDFATILQLCKIDEFCRIYTMIQLRTREGIPLRDKIWALLSRKNLYLHAAQESYSAWLRSHQSHNAQQKLVRIYQSGDWQHGSDVYIKRTTNLEQGPSPYLHIPRHY